MSMMRGEPCLVSSFNGVLKVGGPRTTIPCSHSLLPRMSEKLPTTLIRITYLNRALLALYLMHYVHAAIMDDVLAVVGFGW